MEKEEFLKYFEDLVRRYAERVLEVCYRFTYSREEAQDLSQEVFLKVYKNLAKFREDSSLDTWIYRIAYNSGIDYLRKRRTKVVSIENIEIRDEAGREDVSRREFMDILKERIINLPKMQKIVFMMRHFDNLGIDEIARILNLSPSSVKTHLKRAVLNLRSSLERYVY